MAFNATIQQMLFLFLLIILGYLLAKMKLVPENAQNTLSKLENYVFIPALCMGTFTKNFTVNTLVNNRTLLLISFLIELVVIPISIVVVKLLSKDKYTQNIFLYGLCFPNFGFMGNAIVSALFPEWFMEYLIFCLVLQIFLYLWGIPVLLLGETEQKSSILMRLKNLINPMFICMILGMIWGVSGLETPTFAQSILDSLGACMSPIAMLLTGMVIAKSKLSEVLSHKNIYAISVVRLIVYPLIFLAVARLFKLEGILLACGLCSLSMPLGLNTIVIPSAYGKDTTKASGMTIVSHLLACITIPLFFMFLGN